MVHKRIQEWDDPNEDNEEFTIRPESISEDAIVEIREISSNKGWYSRDKILKSIPSEKIIESIRNYREIIRELESELASRSVASECIDIENIEFSVQDIGSLRFLDSEAYFTLGRPTRNNKKGRTSKSNRLATGRKSVAVKLQDFINKLTLTEDEKVNLLEEWNKITKGEYDV